MQRKIIHIRVATFIRPIITSAGENMEKETVHSWWEFKLIQSNLRVFGKMC